jgi:hypothetical protein
MSKFLLCVALVLLVGQAAFATPELFLKTGATSVVAVGVGNTVTFSSGSFGGWDITVIAGKSNSPTTNPGLDIASLTASCVGVCSALDAWLSDTGFTTVNSSFVDTYSATITGTGGSATEKSWVGLGNILFQSNGADGPPTVAGGPLIGIVGPFTTPGAHSGSAAGGPAAGPAPYSLTIEDIFLPSAGVTYSTDGAITGVPEPASVVLLGGLLLFCSSRLRRRKA